MNSSAKKIIRNFSYTLFTNLVSLLISTLVVLILPKLLGVEAYGYWQLYLFYSSYVGFLHFGWNDGIYLRFGGKEYKELDKSLFFSQFYMLLMLQVLILILTFYISDIYIVDHKRNFIVNMVALTMLFMNMWGMLSFILQATNRIKEYARITLLSRILYFGLLMSFILVGFKNYEIIIAADLIGKFILFIFGIYYCKDIVFRNITTFYFSFKETIQNINVGIKLMFANIASALIIGVVRFGIDRSWDVATFGKVALTLSISNFMMLFINSMGIVLFPILRRTDEKRLGNIYIPMRDFLTVLLVGSMLFYFPLKFFLSSWLPNYTESLMYMALLFPMVIFEGKTSLLINTYLKTLRKEKLMLRINLISLIFSIILTGVTTILYKHLDLTIVSIVFVLAMRSILAEILLSKIIKIFILKDIILEIVLTLIFILVSWFLTSWEAILIYLLSYIIYLLIKRKDIDSSVRYLKLMMKS